MRKIITILCLLVMTTFLSAQSLKKTTKALKKVKNIEQLDEIKNKYPDWKISIDKTLLSDSMKFPDITSAKIGDVVTKQYNPKAPKYALKVLSIEDEELCKVKYIYLDGTKYSITVIDSIRTSIIKRYLEGEDFEALVKEYTMDGNLTGDLDWFYQGMMVEEFDEAVRNKSKGEVFTVDVKSENWYYVVLKNHRNKTEKAVNGIKIKYSM